MFFSSNGSFVVNKHTYTILGMKRSLKAMNRLNEIRTRNKKEERSELEREKFTENSSYTQIKMKSLKVGDKG